MSTDNLISSIAAQCLSLRILNASDGSRFDGAEVHAVVARGRFEPRDLWDQHVSGGITDYDDTTTWIKVHSYARHDDEPGAALLRCLHAIGRVFSGEADQQPRLRIVGRHA